MMKGTHGVETRATSVARCMMRSEFEEDWMNRVVVVDTSKSPHAKLQPVGLSEVTLNDAFWAPRRQVNREKTIPQQYRQCEATGRIDNFRRASGHNKDPAF